MSQRIRVSRGSVAWWLRHFRFTVDRWEVDMKYGRENITVGYYDARDPQSSHQFFF
jgi:hypothetical protein